MTVQVRSVRCDRQAQVLRLKIRPLESVVAQMLWNRDSGYHENFVQECLKAEASVRRAQDSRTVQLQRQVKVEMLRVVQYIFTGEV